MDHWNIKRHTLCETFWKGKPYCISKASLLGIWNVQGWDLIEVKPKQTRYRRVAENVLRTYFSHLQTSCKPVPKRIWPGKFEWVNHAVICPEFMLKKYQQYCWWKKSFTSWWVVDPIVYKVSFIPGGAQLLPSTLCILSPQSSLFWGPTKTTLFFRVPDRWGL